jgi:site-specific DNA-cytosine methylase
VTWRVVSAAPLTAQARRRVYFVGFREVAAERFVFPSPPDLGLAVGDVGEAVGRDDGAGREAPPPDLGLAAGGAGDADDAAGRDGDAGREAEARAAVARATLSARQFEDLCAAVCQRRGLHSTLAWDGMKAAPIVSHYGHSPSNGASQLRPQPAPRRPRLFTLRECLRLMGFPEQFQLAAPAGEHGEAPGRRQSAQAATREGYRMVGNAVCPPVVAALAAAVVAHCRASASADADDSQAGSHASGHVRSGECGADLAEAGLRAATALARCALPCAADAPVATGARAQRARAQTLPSVT